MAVLVQIVATVIVSLPCFNLGIVSTLPSSTLAGFISANTTLERPMTDMEVNLFGSLASVGSLVGTLVVSPLMDRIGRKYCTLLSGFFGVLGWVILTITLKVEVVLVAIFICGMSGATYMILPAFCAEFCQESIRGTVTSCSMVFTGVGVMVSYILGGCMGYEMMVYSSLLMGVVELLLMFWLKESPTLLMMKGREEEAARSIAFYRQVKVNSKLVTKELASIRRVLNLEEYSVIHVETGIPHSDGEVKPADNYDSNTPYIPKKLTIWKHFHKSETLRRGFYITMAMIGASMFQGQMVLQVYAGPVFTVATSAESANMCCLLFSIATVVTSTIAAYVSDVAGRRPLMIYASIGGGLCCILFGAQLQYSWASNWVTPMFLYLFTTFYSFGGGTVPFVLLSEVFLPEVKSFISMIVIIWMSVCYFITTLTFFPLASLLGMGGVFHLYGVIGILTALGAALFVPETKGLKLEVVQIMLAEKRTFPPKII